MAQQSLLLASKRRMRIEGIGVAGCPSKLRNRITRLMGNAREPRVRLRYTWAIGLVLAAIVGLSTASYKVAGVQQKAKDDASGETKQLIESGSVQDSLSKQIAEIFAKADKLQERKRQRSREYLASLTDEELARIYAGPPGAKGSFAFDVALRAVKQDRKHVTGRLHGKLNEEEREAFRSERQKLIDELAALGAKAVPTLATRTGYDYMRRGHFGMASQALSRMDRTAVEPLIALMDSDNGFVRINAAYALSRLADPRAKDVLLRAVDDAYGPVHSSALTGLIELGPQVVGSSALVAHLIDGLQDRSCLSESIRGLERYGDETAIESLGVIERFWPGRGQRDVRYRARQAINAILRRAGKAVKEVRREDYSTELSRDELFAAAEHSNAAIRWQAVEQLASHGRDYSEYNRIALFLVERIKQERDPMVLQCIAQSLYWPMMQQRKDSPESFISPQNTQKAFDAFLSVLEKSGLRARKVSARIQDTTTAKAVELSAAAIRGAGNALDAANKHGIRLERIERFKTILRMWSLSSDDPELRFVSYEPIATIANITPKTGKSWSPEEREELQQQLASLLDSPTPDSLLIKCLGHVGDERIAPRMIELLGHDDSYIRRYAAGALGRIGDPRALPALEHLAETDPVQYEEGVFHVRKAATEAVAKIKAKQEPDVQIEGENIRNGEKRSR